MASSVASPAVGSIQAAQSLPLSNGSTSLSRSVPLTAFFGASLKKSGVSIAPASSSKSMVVCALEDEAKQTKKDRWAGLAYDTSDDQQDITRGKGMVDSLFQGAVGVGTQHAVMSSYEYLSTAQRTFQMDNMKDGLYIAPAFMDKLVVHIAKNFMDLPNIKVPLILGIWGGKGQGKSFQCELVFSKLGINPIMMSAGELESGNAGEPAKLIRQRYREAADIIQKKGKMCCLFINDLDAGAGRMGGTTQYTVNNQMVNATLMNIADNPTNVQLPGIYIKEEIPRVPIIVTGNDFSTLYAPLIRDGRMEKFYWAPTREDRIGVCKGIFRADNVRDEEVVKLVDTFPGQSIDFFGALRARVYDDEVRKWVANVGVDSMGKMLVNSREGPPTFQKPAMTVEKLLEYGQMLVQEQENVKRVQLADKYLKEAALGDANDDAIKQGSFYGQAAQHVKLPVPEGCTDPSAENFDPTARSDNGKVPPAAKDPAAVILQEEKKAEEKSIVEEKSEVKAIVGEGECVQTIEKAAAVEEKEEKAETGEEPVALESTIVEEEKKPNVVEEQKPTMATAEQASVAAEKVSPPVQKEGKQGAKKNGDEGRELSREVVTGALRNLASSILSFLKR